MQPFYSCLLRLPHCKCVSLPHCHHKTHLSVGKTAFRQTRRCLCQAYSSVHYYHSQLCDCLTRTTWPSQHLDTAWHCSSSSRNTSHNGTRQPHTSFPKSIPSHYVSDNEQTSERKKKYVFMVYNTILNTSLHIWKYYNKIKYVCLIL
jgi:hypothetical protein